MIKLDKKRLLSPILMIVMVMLFSACSKEATIYQSRVDGVSDEVYKQLVQQYFYMITLTGVLTGEIQSEELTDRDWYAELDLFKEAEEYAEKNDDITMPMQVFPNPLLYEYRENPESYTDEEQTYIETMLEFKDAQSRLDLSEYEPLKKQLKEDLKIEDADNMFKVKDPS